MLMMLTMLDLLLCSVPDRRLELPTVVFDHDTRLHHETSARQQEHLLGVGVGLGLGLGRGEGARQQEHLLGLGLELGLGLG